MKSGHLVEAKQSRDPRYYIRRAWPLLSILIHIVKYDVDTDTPMGETYACV